MTISLLGSPENLVLYPNNTPQLIILLILITCLPYSVLKKYCYKNLDNDHFLGVKGLSLVYRAHKHKLWQDKSIENRVNDVFAKFTTSPYLKVKTNLLPTPKLPVAEEMHQTREKLMADSPCNLIHPLYGFYQQILSSCKI